MIGNADMKANPHIATLDAYALTDTSGGLISLAQNESLRPPSPHAIAVAATAAANAQLYSDPGWTKLRAAIAKVHAIDPEVILCGAGSMELIAALAGAYLGPNERALTTAHGYLFFRTATRIAGAQIDLVSEPDMTIDVDALAAAITPETRIVFIANPGNPTGTRIDIDALWRLRTSMPCDVMLVVDEAYGEFSDTGRADESTFNLIQAGNTVILRTLSKAYGLAGQRIGWGAFPLEIASEVRKVLNPNNISSVSLAMATAAMRDQNYMRETVQLTHERRVDFMERVRKTGIFIPESYANFALLQFSSDEQAGAADAALRECGLLARAMGGYGLANCLRVTVGDEAAMLRTSVCLERFMEGQT